jgi:hypothetical protein
LEWFFHFNVDIPIQASLDGILTQCQEGANLFLRVLGDTQLHMNSEEGWVSPSYGVKYKAQVVHYSFVGELPVSIFFLLYPFKDAKQLAILPDNCIEDFEKNWGRCYERALPG